MSPYDAEKRCIIPYFLHDCDHCIFIMQRSGQDANGILPAGYCDVYVCPGEPTVVVRYGDDGWLYSSRMGHGKDSWFAWLWQHMRETFGESEVAIYKSQLRHAVKQRKRTERAIVRSFRRKRNRELRRATAKLFRDEFPLLDDSAEQIF